jgi:hypothetical protein
MAASKRTAFAKGGGRCHFSEFLKLLVPPLAAETAFRSLAVISVLKSPACRLAMKLWIRGMAADMRERLTTTLDAS